MRRPGGRFSRAYIRPLLRRQRSLLTVNGTTVPWVNSSAGPEKAVVGIRAGNLTSAKRIRKVLVAFECQRTRVRGIVPNADDRREHRWVMRLSGFKPNPEVYRAHRDPKCPSHLRGPDHLRGPAHLRDRRLPGGPLLRRVRVSGAPACRQIPQRALRQTLESARLRQRPGVLAVATTAISPRTKMLSELPLERRRLSLRGKGDRPSRSAR